MGHGCGRPSEYLSVQFDADKTINQFVDGMSDGSKDGAKVVSPPPYSIHRDTLDGAQMVSVQVANALTLSQTLLLSVVAQLFAS